MEVSKSQIFEKSEESFFYSVDQFSESKQFEIESDIDLYKV